MTGRCAVPKCTEALPDGPHAIFCADHHFQLPHKTTAFLFRWQMKTTRCGDEVLKQYMREQLAGYVAQAVRQIPEIAGPRVSSQAAPAGVRQASLMMTDAATNRQVRHG